MTNENQRNNEYSKIVEMLMESGLDELGSIVSIGGLVESLSSVDDGKMLREWGSDYMYAINCYGSTKRKYDETPLEKRGSLLPIVIVTHDILSNLREKYGGLSYDRI